MYEMAFVRVDRNTLIGALLPAILRNIDILNSIKDTVTMPDSLAKVELNLQLQNRGFKALTWGTSNEPLTTNPN
jgi:hypothetical protein